MSGQGDGLQDLAKAVDSDVQKNEVHKSKKLKAKGKDRKGRGSFKNKQHWRRVEQYCNNWGSMEPECIDSWFAALDRENWLEWSVSIKTWYKNQPWIALFGGWFTLLAWWYAIDLVIWPNKMPSINDAPWKDVGFWRALEIMGMTATANMVQPNWFFLS